MSIHSVSMIFLLFAIFLQGQSLLNFTFYYQRSCRGSRKSALVLYPEWVYLKEYFICLHPALNITEMSRCRKEVIAIVDELYIYLL